MSVQHKGLSMQLVISRENLEALAVTAARTDLRYYLNGICFMPGGVMASTDGHRLLVINNRDDVNLNADLQDNAIMSIPSKFPTRKYDYAIFDIERGLISYVADRFSLDSQESIYQASLTREHVSVTKLIEGRYPDVNRVLPKGDPVAVSQIAFNTGYLADVNKIGKALKSGKFEIANFEFYGATAAAVATISTPFSVAKYVVMPCRV